MHRWFYICADHHSRWYQCACGELGEDIEDGGRALTSSVCPLAVAP